MYATSPQIGIIDLNCSGLPGIISLRLWPVKTNRFSAFNFTPSFRTRPVKPCCTIFSQLSPGATNLTKVGGPNSQPNIGLLLEGKISDINPK
jgi:hypothetical protein